MQFNLYAIDSDRIFFQFQFDVTKVCHVFGRPTDNDFIKAMGDDFLVAIWKVKHLKTQQHGNSNSEK